MTKLEFYLAQLLEDMQAICTLAYQKNFNPLPSLRVTTGLQVLFKHSIDYVYKINESVEQQNEPIILVELNKVDSHGKIDVEVSLIPSKESYSFSKTTIRALTRHNFDNEAILELEQQYCCGN